MERDITGAQIKFTILFVGESFTGQRVSDYTFIYSSLCCLVINCFIYIKLYSILLHKIQITNVQCQMKPWNQMTIYTTSLKENPLYLLLFFFLFGYGSNMWNPGSQQGLNPCPCQWKHGLNAH